MAKSKLLYIYLVTLFCLAAAQALADAHKPTHPLTYEYTGTYELQQIEPALDGSDVSITALCRSLSYLNGEPLNDYRPLMSHNCFTNNNFQLLDSAGKTPGTSSHATEIAAILAGRDPNAYHPEIGNFVFKGPASQAEVRVYEFWHFVMTRLYNLPTDGQNQLFDLDNDPSSDILTISLGVPFEDWWTRGLQSLAEQTGTVITASAGNGSDVYDPLFYPAAGSNVICVGVVDPVVSDEPDSQLRYFTLPRRPHSSSGPTADQRSKPDIVAPGKSVVPDSTYDDLYHISGSYSSYATPVTAATAALLVQKLKQLPEYEDSAVENSRATLIKAVLLNSAEKMAYWHKGNVGTDDDQYVPLDWLQGAGLLDAVAAYEQLTAGRQGPGNCDNSGWDSNLATPNRANVYTITPDAEAVGWHLTATLVWNRHYDNSYPFDRLEDTDRDLKLELWGVDSDGRAELIGICNSPADNLEHIHLRIDRQYNSLELVVDYSDADNRLGNESYSLAWRIVEDRSGDDLNYYDLNGDGKLDIEDTIVLMNYQGMSSQPGDRDFITGDINMDLKVDSEDLRLMAARLHEVINKPK